MKLIEYMPPFLRNVREFKEIFEKEELELENLKNQIEKVLQEVIVQTATSYGLERYEKIYNIKNTSNNLTSRRYNILAKINNKAPYTIKWLKNKLDNTVGKENYRINIDYDKPILKIEILAIFKEIATLLQEDLRKQLPANLQVIVELFQTEECHQYVAGIVHSGDYLRLRQVI